MCERTERKGTQKQRETEKNKVSQLVPELIICRYFLVKFVTAGRTGANCSLLGPAYGPAGRRGGNSRGKRFQPGNGFSAFPLRCRDWPPWPCRAAEFARRPRPSARRLRPSPLWAVRLTCGLHIMSTMTHLSRASLSNASPSIRLSPKAPFSSPVPADSTAFDFLPPVPHLRPVWLAWRRCTDAVLHCANSNGRGTRGAFMECTLKAPRRQCSARGLALLQHAARCKFD